MPAIENRQTTCPARAPQIYRPPIVFAGFVFPDPGTRFPIPEAQQSIYLFLRHHRIVTCLRHRIECPYTMLNANALWLSIANAMIDIEWNIFRLCHVKQRRAEPQFFIDL